MKRFIFFISLFFAFPYLQAQKFGGEPSSIKWEQVNTDTVRIIFPEGLDSLAKCIAATTLKEQQDYSGTIGPRIKKINILLHAQTILSNGFVTLSPWHSEFFLMPQQNNFELGSISWPGLLSIHEYRHAQQYSNFNVGFSHVMNILFGENGQALANAASVPDWFFEGDAVFNETMLSKQGRGRLPLFLNGFKVLYLQNKNYAYMKLRNGSFKNYIPDHYPLGYMLVAYGREKYGDDFWKYVTHRAASYRPLIYPMQHAISRYANVSFNAFVQNTFEYFQSQWKDESLSGLQFINPPEKNNVVDEKYPYSTGDGSIIFLKKSYNGIPQFTLHYNNGFNEKIAVQDITDDDYFSYNNGKIVYASYKPDIRWGNREYSDIKLIDVNTKQETKIKAHSNYFYPDISHNGKMIAAIKQTGDGKSILYLMDLSGEIIRGVENRNGNIFSYPKFSADDKFIYVCDRNESGAMSILKQAVEGGSLQTVIPYENRIIGFPVVQNDTVFYSCSNNGRDEIWAYVNTSGKNFRVASSATGLYQATTNGNKIVTAAFTADGYRLANIKELWQVIDDADTLKNLYVKHPFQNISNSFLQNVNDMEFKVSRYSKATGLFNFHSYNPSFSDPDYSFILFGQNILNTFQSQLYYTYNRDEKFSRVGYTGIYGGWYVQPFIDVNQTWGRTQQLNTDTSFNHNETKIAGGLRLPLNFTGGKWYRNFTSSLSYNYSNVQWTGIAKQFFSNTGIGYMQLQLHYSQFTQQAIKHIYPHWGQSLLLQYRNGNTAHQFLVNSYFYFPGLAKTHSFVINLAYQARDTSGKFYYDNNFPFSRGYFAVDYPRLYKAAFNYSFPMAYPDWGFGNLVYFLRIRANLFYDFSQAKSLRTGNRFDFASAGAEVFFDTKWWNQQPISFGIRYSRLLNRDFEGRAPNQWEVILPLNL